jgi:hypothetical protein
MVKNPFVKEKFKRLLYPAKKPLHSCLPRPQSGLPICR